MWALRSYLRRPNPSVTSRLRPVRRHDATHIAVPCRSLIPAASRRHFSDATKGDLHQPTAAATKPHLYLVLDDQKKDYGIYKLDVGADLLDGDVGSDSAMTTRGRFPHPAHIRMEVTKDPEQSAQFAAAGGCIVATGCSPYRGLAHSDDYGIVTVLYDIKTPGLYTSLHPTVTLHYGYQLAVPVGKRLYVFDSYAQSEDQDGFHCMTTAKDGEEDTTDDGEVKQRDWGWWYDSGSSRIGWSESGASCYSSEQLPFSANGIQAQAVHPRDCTIFVSAPVDYDDVHTFVFDTTGDNYKWRRYGRWAMPFKGHAHYDRQLNMWVGLQSTSSMEKILLDDPDQRRIDYKLVYMAERGEYCLFERLGRPGAPKKQQCLADGEKCVLRLTTFRLKYERDEPDYLRIMDRRTGSYKVSRYREDFEAQAFWI
ncbi:unnamed protein product [Alopecurus aequalis]